MTKSTTADATVASIQKLVIDDGRLTIRQII